MHKLKNRQQEDDIFVLLHLVWSNFGCGVILECSTLFLVTSAIDIHRNLLAIRIWVTERNCSSRYIHSNILILWILVSSNKISVSLNALHYDLVLWRESARALFCQPEFATYGNLTCIFLNHWSVSCLANAEQKRFQILLLQCIVYTYKSRINTRINNPIK